MLNVGKLGNYKSLWQWQSWTCTMKRWCPAKMVPSVSAAEGERMGGAERKGAFLQAGRGLLPNRLISISAPSLSSPLSPLSQYLLSGAERERGWHWGLHSAINIKRLTCPTLLTLPLLSRRWRKQSTASQSWQSEPWEKDAEQQKKGWDANVHVFTTNFLNAAYECHHRRLK